MRYTLLQAALTGVTFLTASAASAAGVTFDFTTFTSNTSQDPGVYSSGLMSVTATATGGVNAGVVAERTSPSWIRGLGVISGESLNGSIEVGEVLEFVLPAGFMVSEVGMSRHSSTDQSFSMLVDTTSVGGGTITNQNNATVNGSQMFAAASIGGSSLFIIPDSSNTGGIWVNSISLEEITSAPLPAGVVLLGGALAFGGAAARRKTQKT